MGDAPQGGSAVPAATEGVEAAGEGRGPGETMVGGREGRGRGWVGGGTGQDGSAVTLPHVAAAPTVNLMARGAGGGGSAVTRRSGRGWRGQGRGLGERSSVVGPGVRIWLGGGGCLAGERPSHHEAPRPPARGSEEAPPAFTVTRGLGVVCHACVGVSGWNFGVEGGLPPPAQCKSRFVSHVASSRIVGGVARPARDTVRISRCRLRAPSLRRRPPRRRPARGPPPPHAPAAGTRGAAYTLRR